MTCNRMFLFIIFLQLLLISCNGNSTAVQPRISDNDLDYPERLMVQKDIRQRILQSSSFRPEIFQAFHFHRFPADQINSVSKIPLSQLQQESQDLGRKATQCDRDLLFVIIELMAKKSWAIEMLDSFSKPPSGILRGQLWWTGNYEQCLKVDAPPSSSYSTNGFHGNYAWLNVTVKTTLSASPISLNIGTCLPSTCRQDNHFVGVCDSLVHFLNKSNVLRRSLSLTPKVELVFTPTDYSLSTASIACICVCGVFASLLILGTLLDIVLRHKRKNNLNIERIAQGTPVCNGKENDSDHLNGSMNGNTSSKEENSLDNDHLLPSYYSPATFGWQKFLLCFSAITNTESILDTSSAQNDLRCLHGIRFLTMGWVMLGNTMYYGVTYFENILDLIDLIHNWPIQLILQTGLSVDTFFLLSGCLLTYRFLKNAHALTGLKDWVLFYLHRYIRLTSVYAMLLFIFATWWNNIGDGPFWNFSNRDTCSKTWWWNVLYINNFINALDMCMNWTFFSASEMQYFIISPLFLLAFKRNRNAGLVVVLALLVASWIATGIIMRQSHLPVSFGSFGNITDFNLLEDQQRESWDQLFTKPYTRIGPFLIGVVLGYILKEVNGKKGFLNKYLVVLGWLISQMLSLLLIYGLEKVVLGPATASAYTALGRTAWGISVAWIIFACLTGHAGPVNVLLSWKAWIPLSRLTYCAYLVHPMVMLWYYSSLRTTLYFSINHVATYVGLSVLSYGLAFIASLLFERPILRFENLVKERR